MESRAIQWSLQNIMKGHDIESTFQYSVPKLTQKTSNAQTRIRTRKERVFQILWGTYSRNQIRLQTYPP